MDVPIVAITGYSDSGKTTLIEKLIPRLVARGLKVGTIKHDAHGFDMDHQGKDSYRHKRAGASTTVIASPRQVGMVKDVEIEPGLEELAELYLSDVDLIVAEGYKGSRGPKIEIYRKGQREKLFGRPEDGLIAVACNCEVETEVPRFDLNDVEAIADFVFLRFGFEKTAASLSSPPKFADAQARK